MIEQIKKASDRKFDDIKRLQNTDSKIIMYGAGSYAEDVNKFLKKQNIHISAYCVDEQWLSNASEIDGTKVMSVERVLKEYDDLLVVIGFADYKKARARLEELRPGISSIFIDAPNQLGFFDYNYLVMNADKFEDTYNNLSDKMSKDIFIAFINAKLSGDPSPLYEYANLDQYFSEPMSLTDAESMVDCGAYDGDTVKSFLEHVNGKFNKIYAFEPNLNNYKKLKEFTIKSGIDDIELVNKGAWSKTDTLRFNADANMTIIGSDEGESVEVDTIDNVVGEDKITLIKMDIEGAELEALRGATSVIKRDHPKLAICVYHKPEDLITIPQYVQSLYPNYKLYLRHHQYMSWEMVMYAIPA